jgi:beta-galactosidase
MLRSPSLLALLSTLVLSMVPLSADAAEHDLKVIMDESGGKLLVDGQPFFIKGMNWSYVPIGQNYGYSLWVQPDSFIEEVLHREMSMLRDLGVNSLRLFDDVPPKWVAWIYENYGIYSMINPHFGRYGLTVNGAWVSQTDYSNPAHRAAILAEVRETAERFKDVPGVMMIMLGNENNYGLVWSSFEIEALPKEEQGRARAEHLYSLWGEGIDIVHEVAPGIPAAICNGDLQYLDLVAEHVGKADLFGTNVYRGRSAGDLYQKVRDELGMPIFFSEFGSDAFHAKNRREDTALQAGYVRDQWEDIYINAYGRGAGTAIGGYQFQWSDGWWKYRQTENLDVHDPTASWPNSGYPEDLAPGRNNMNEEWFGITAKGPPDDQGHFLLYPRPAFYVLQDAWQLDPYASSTDEGRIRAHFDRLNPSQGALEYRTQLAAGEVDRLKRAYVRGVRLDLTGLTTEDSTRAGTGKQRLDYDHGQSAYIDFGLEPTDQLRARAEVNVLGNVAQNPIDKLSYESRAGRLIADPDDPDYDPDTFATMQASDRVRLYAAEAQWEHDQFTMNAFYRVGHFHWGYEGDFFGIYRQAFYGPNIDIYDAAVPIGVEFEGKNALDGLAIAGGPQVYWGANPAVFGRYGWDLGKSRWTVVHQEDITQQGAAAANRAIPQLVTRKTALHIERPLGGLHLDLGGIMAGTDRLGMTYEDLRPASDSDLSYQSSGYHVYEDTIQWIDTLGTKAKLTWEPGRTHIYVQGAYRGLVADGGPDETVTFTGWTLKDGGQGNGIQLLSGVAVDVGTLQVAPNFLYQKPFVGPIDPVGSTFNPDTGYYYPGVAARNFIDDPFAVMGNRETIAGEMLFVWDPTPGTWFWAWDNPLREDAPFAASLDLVYRHQPTTTDANFGFTEDGTLFAFASAPAATDVWTATLTTLSRLPGDKRLQLAAMTGQETSSGDSDRVVWRTMVSGDLWIKKTALKTSLHWNDWGPFDFHRTFNLTYPFQARADLSTGLRGFALEDPGTRLGARFKYRTFDEFSPEPELFNGEGHELEVFTYLSLRM